MCLSVLVNALCAWVRVCVRARAHSPSSHRYVKLYGQMAGKFFGPADAHSTFKRLATKQLQNKMRTANACPCGSLNTNGSARFICAGNCRS